VRYLLDADWAIYVLAGRLEPATLLEQFIQTDGVGMSWVTVGELYEGAFGSSDAQGELAIYRRFLRPITLLNLDDNTVERFAELRASLRREGRLIPDLDLLLAATALRHDLTVLTFNIRHLHRIPGIKLWRQR
jgi:tRNA(fMet)-specific endonuclease VapC